MEVESTEVHVRPDGKKFIDVTLRRQVVPSSKFDDDSSDSSDSDSEDRDVIFHPAAPALAKKAPFSTSNSRNSNGEDGNDNNDDESTTATDEATTPADSGQMQQTFQGHMQWDGVQEIQQLTNANAQLTSQARDLREQVKSLQVQLEVLSPIPGLDVQAVQDILLEKDDTEHDIRDVKIVHQAKSLRALKRAVQREKQLAVDAVKQCKLMEAAKQKMEQELDTATLKLQRFQARAEAAASANASMIAIAQVDDHQQDTSSPSPSPSRTPESADSGVLKKQYEELKAKNVALQQELKKTQRALVREVGEDVSLDEIIGNTDATASGAARRGRAQHIIMLKAKVKKLQAQLTASTTNATVAENPEPASTTPSIDVDKRAQQDISGQHMHRQKLLDQLTSQRDELQERVHRVTRSYDALKARTKILEREKQETRDKFHVLVDKSHTDDALVDALQRQLETWKTKLHEARRARTAESKGSQEERAELERLRRIVAAHKAGGDRMASPRASSGSMMPQPSEAAQYRALATEKERLVEVVRDLKTQLEDKDKQLRSMAESSAEPDKEAQDVGKRTPAAPALPPIGDGSTSRIPRRPGSMIPAPGGRSASRGDALAFAGPPAPAAVAAEQHHQQLKHEMETLRRTFRESMREKDERIAQLEQQQLVHSAGGNDDDRGLVQELQELQEENTFLRQEFDKLKARYEAMAKTASSSKHEGAKKKALVKPKAERG